MTNVWLTSDTFLEAKSVLYDEVTPQITIHSIIDKIGDIEEVNLVQDNKEHPIALYSVREI